MAIVKRNPDGRIATHVPTEGSTGTRALVKLHAAIGTDHVMLARILGITPKTLRKHYREELDLGLALANAQVGGKLFNKAMAGDTASCIFWMKARAGWSERSVHAITGPNGGPVETIGRQMTPQEAALAYAATLTEDEG